MFTSLMDMKSQKIERYTRRTRRQTNRDRYEIRKIDRIQRRLDSILRSALYSALRLFLRNRPFQKRLPVRTIKSVLIIPYGDAIGDMIVATPVWRAIKRQNPDCVIGVIASERNITLIDQDRNVDEIFQYTGRSDLQHVGELLRARRKHYDLILNLHFQHQTDYGIIANVIGPRSIKITGHHPRRELYEIFFNHIGSRPRQSCHISQLSLELLEDVVSFDPPLTMGDTIPSLDIDEKSRRIVSARLVALKVTKFVLINMQAATPFREWGIGNTLDCAQAIRALHPDMKVLLSASPYFDWKLAQELPEGVLRFETSSNLIELGALIEKTSVVLTPETSIAHFAVATKTPVIVLMPDRDHLPIEWLPIAVSSYIFAPDQIGAPVASIPVSPVVDAISSLLSNRAQQSQTSMSRENPHLLYQEFSSTLSLSSLRNEQYGA